MIFDSKSIGYATAFLAKVLPGQAWVLATLGAGDKILEVVTFRPPYAGAEAWIKKNIDKRRVRVLLAVPNKHLASRPFENDIQRALFVAVSAPNSSLPILRRLNPSPALIVRGAERFAVAWRYKPDFQVTAAQALDNEKALLSAIPGSEALALFFPVPRTKDWDYDPSVSILPSQIKAPAAKSKPTERDPIKRLLVDTLEQFGVQSSVTQSVTGPVVTVHDIELAPGTKATKVTERAEDIADIVGVRSIYVDTAPGKGEIGKRVISIHLPNAKRQKVLLRDLLKSPAFQRSTDALPLALGKSISGEPVVVDLARMPHLLMAGTTGSGKSVTVNAMILSLLCKFGPDECNFILIDPKGVELSPYADIPHLLAPVVTKPKLAIEALEFAAREMEERYDLLIEAGAKDLASYNTRTGKRLPRIVIVIDEMADLVMSAKKEVEDAIQRLAQKARAAGIHLILATQTPRKEIVTGVIKTNLPCRIALTVSSAIDSRVILDAQGAEQLLGEGDMLYKPANSDKLTRVHGAFVTEEEIEAAVKRLRSQGAPRYRDDIFSEEEGTTKGRGRGRQHRTMSTDSRVTVRVSPKLAAAMEWLERALSDGPQLATEIKRQAKGQIAYGTLHNAREELGVRVVEGETITQPKVWLLPPPKGALSDG